MVCIVRLEVVSRDDYYERRGILQGTTVGRELCRQRTRITLTPLGAVSEKLAPARAVTTSAGMVERK